jgi:pyruvate/2-oxoacid:ferredoxin oxidoreductase beta subunit
MKESTGYKYKSASMMLIKRGIEHQGFSFLDVFSPCVTYNHDNTHQWFRPRVKRLEEDASHARCDSPTEFRLV